MKNGFLKILLSLILLGCFFSINTLSANASTVAAQLNFTNDRLYDDIVLDDYNHYPGLNYGTELTINNTVRDACREFDHSYIDLGLMHDFNFDTGDFAIEVIMYPYNVTGTTGTISAIAGKNYFSANTFGLYIASSKLCFGYNPAIGTINTPSNIAPNTWYHVVANKIGNNMSLYNNGQYVTSKTGTGTINSSAYTFRIGSQVGNVANYYFNGTIACVIIHEGGLTPEEIQSRYQAALPLMSYDPRLNTNGITPTQNSEDITDKLLRNIYGRNGLPMYMGDYAIRVNDSNAEFIAANQSTLYTISAPEYTSDGSAVLNTATLSGYQADGDKQWKDYVAAPCIVTLSYTGTDRIYTNSIEYDDYALKIGNSVRYTDTVDVTTDGYTITYPYETTMLADSGTISYTNPTLYEKTTYVQTDNANIQTYLIHTAAGEETFQNWQTRPQDTVKTSNVTLCISNSPVYAMPAPNGDLGVVMFANHADHANASTIKAVFYGTNNTSSPDYGQGGFIGNGINVTWSAFYTSDAPFKGFSDPEFKACLDDLYNNGSEIIPHRTTAVQDNRSQAEVRLPYYYTNYSSRNWIDHDEDSGNRNIGLSSLGNVKSNSSYYIMDLMEDYGYEYAWSYKSFNPNASSKNVYWNPYIDMRNPFVNKIGVWNGIPADEMWQNTNLKLDPSNEPIWQWNDIILGHKTYSDSLTTANIDGLANYYGVTVLHGYYAYAHDAADTVPYYYTDTPTELVINTTFNAKLAYIKTKIDDNSLWNPTVSQYGDYYKQIVNVKITNNGPNTYTITNNNPGTVYGYSLRTPGAKTPTIDGAPMSTKTYGSDTIMWVDLTPGTHTLVIS